MIDRIINVMKRSNYVTLHFILSAILITMGLLLIFKGRDITPGTAELLFLAPGITIFSGIFIEFFHFKSHLVNLCLYLLIYVVLLVAIYIQCHLSLSLKMVTLMAVTMILSVLISCVFHFIYDNLRHPDRLIRF